MDYPICPKCHKSILWHTLNGFRAYCTPERSKETRAAFSAKEVNNVRRTLGHSLSQAAQDAEMREE